MMRMQGVKQEAAGEEKKKYVNHFASSASTDWLGETPEQIAGTLKFPSAKGNFLPHCP